MKKKIENKTLKSLENILNARFVLERNFFFENFRRIAALRLTNAKLCAIFSVKRPVAMSFSQSAVFD